MSENTTRPKLLSEEFLRKLEQLDLVYRKASAGRLRGERPSRRRGIGTDFADYRNYVAGDDPRFIDWNIYGRLERLFLKLFVEEEDLNLHVLLDTSASMGFGEPDKFDFAKRLAAALSYIGLVSQNRVTLSPMSAEGAHALGPVRGRRGILRVFSYLEGLTPSGRTRLAAAARSWALGRPRKGIAILISDLLDPGDSGTLGFDDALPYLGGKSLDAYVLHVMASDELEPEFKGDLRLIDGETNDFTEVSMGAPILKRYRANLMGFLEHLNERCLTRGLPYLLARSDTPFEKVILQALRRGGLLR